MTAEQFRLAACRKQLTQLSSRKRGRRAGFSIAYVDELFNTRPKADVR